MISNTEEASYSGEQSTTTQLVIKHLTENRGKAKRGKSDQQGRPFELVYNSFFRVHK